MRPEICALIDAAVTVVKDDPKRAAELGALALRTGRPNNNIRERLGRLLNSLLYVAFPAQRGITENVPIPPEPLRIELLQLLVNLLNAKPAEDKCEFVAWISPLFTQSYRCAPNYDCRYYTPRCNA